MIVRPAPDELKAFRYVTACDKDYIPVYRAIVQIFFDAKQHYVIELHPDDILKVLHRAGYAAIVNGHPYLVCQHSRRSDS